MAQAQSGTSGLVRVTVASGTRRVDLVLPGAVPVAELVPELARSVGLLDPTTVHGGYRLVTSDGRRLTGDAGLSLQGVEDGAVLTVAAGVDDPVPPVYDDVVEAMADVVESRVAPWSAAAARRTTLTAATLLLGLGAVALVVEATTPAAATALVVAVSLVGGAVVLSRGRREPEAAVTVAWTACAYAVAAGLVAADDQRLLGLRLAVAAAGLAAAGVLCVLGLGAGRALLAPAVVAGAALAGCGVVVDRTDVDADVLLSCVLAFVVVVGSVFPWLALGMTSTHADVPGPDDDRPVDPERVAADALVAHQVLVAISATVGILLVVAAPSAVALGVWGALLVTVACGVVMLRTRQYHAGSQVLVGLVSGILGLLVTTVSALDRHPSWRPTVAVVLASAGVLLLGSTLLPSAGSVRRSRLGDVLETAGLVAVVPLLVLAVSMSDRV